MSHDVEKGLAIVDWFYGLLHVYFGLLIAFIFIALIFGWWVEFLVLLPLGVLFIPFRQRARREVFSVIKDCIENNPMFSECVRNTMTPWLMSREEVDYWLGVYLAELLSSKTSQTN
jgi:hypothetical protein